MSKTLNKNIKRVYKCYKNYNKVLIDLKLRRPNFPEFVSEGLIRSILNKTIDPTSRKMKYGDLISDKEGIQECKCFTSKGPISFGNNKWSVLYILDATKINNDIFTLYRVNMTSQEFNNINISKSETFLMQCLQKRRPKITWNMLKPQIINKIDIIFDGNIDDI